MTSREVLSPFSSQMLHKTSININKPVSYEVGNTQNGKYDCCQGPLPISRMTHMTHVPV